MLKNIVLIYLSPTGGTRRAALALAQGLAERVEELDISQPLAEGRTFSRDEVALLAGPVFGGRLPALMRDRLEPLTGGGTRAITVVAYGGRAFDDALLELNDIAGSRGFRVVASGALVTEHSMRRSVAAGRPDAADLRQCRAFAADILKKLEAGGLSAPAVPGNRPYRDWQPLPATPVTSDACVACGLCARRCPTGAIPRQRPADTEAGKCILCMRCVSLCPQHARALPAPVEKMLGQKLAPLEQVRRENACFL